MAQVWNISIELCPFVLCTADTRWQVKAANVLRLSGADSDKAENRKVGWAIRKLIRFIALASRDLAF
jgi:hypothetical protein